MSPILYHLFWGKARTSSLEGPRSHPIVCHCLDVAAVVDALCDARPHGVRAIARLLELDEAECRRLLIVLAAIHDVGKFAPAFQSKAPEYWPWLALGSIEEAHPWPTHHTADGYRWWDSDLRSLVEQALWPGAADVLDVLAMATFGHHGRPIDVARATDISARKAFGPSAHEAAICCVSALLELLAPIAVQSKPPRLARARLASWLVAGFMTTADWIGSREAWFSYHQFDGRVDLAQYWSVARQRARSAVRNEGLVAPSIAANRPFAAIVGSHFDPTPAQRWACDVLLPEGQTLVILEDVTGAGKTEAAQMLVHRMMAAEQAAGAYWAMPTQATANAMYERQRTTVGALFDADTDSHARPSLILAHGHTSLHEGFRSNVISVRPAEAASERIDDDEDVPSAVLCAEFFASNRRAALLADVGAGTVDQALLGVLPSRFNAMRLFGLHNKVLIIDEAHAYDAYMSKELETLLGFQSAFGGSAIVLSATLPQEKRTALMQAWSRGIRMTREGGNRTAPLPRAVDTAYPLATLVGRTSEDSADEILVQEAPLGHAPWSQRRVDVRFVHDVEHVVSGLVASAAKGAAVVWIRNTVRDCLAAASAMIEHGIQPMVFHARFAQCDRQSREADVLRMFGKASGDDRRGRVLIATQVVEQSLDLDFDVMYSDIAPVDLLIQRAGRLWRHPARDARRPAGVPRELVVLCPSIADSPSTGWMKGFLPGTNAVYENTGVLWRTAQVLEDAGAIETPSGLRDLIEAVYGSDDVPDALRAASDRAMGRDQADGAAARFIVLNATDGYHGGAVAWKDDLRAVTRLGHAQTTLRLGIVESDGSIVPWAGESGGAPWKAWAMSEVRVSAQRVPPDVMAEPEFTDAVETARAGWRRFDEEIPIVPMQRDVEGSWRGTMIDPAGKGRIGLVYNHQWGLDFE